MKPLAIFALLAWAPFAPAGIFSPNEPCPFEIAPDGAAKPLPLTVFKLFLNDRVAALQPNSPDIQPGTANAPTFKGLAKLRSSRDVEPDRAGMVGLSADLLRLGYFRGVVELLKPTLQDRSLNYALLAHVSLAHAALGDWDLAIKRNADAVLDGEPPEKLAGTKAEQLKWMLKIDKAYTRTWLLAAQRDANPRSKSDDPDVLALFPKDPPPDAVAVVQQLVLWAPLDTNLLWLLGSLYLDNGQTMEAFDILEQCRERKMTWPKFRIQHARAEALFRALPKDAPEAALPTDDTDVPNPPLPRGWDAIFAEVNPSAFGVAIGAFAALVAGIIWLQIRKWRRVTRIARLR